MARKDHAAHARVTAICVNLALDGVEADIRGEIDNISDEAATALERVLVRLRERRVADSDLRTAGRC
jgi:hypothetical protein